MNDVTYISVEDIKEITSISQNVDPTFLVPYVRAAEGMFVVNILGTALDAELKAMITGGTLTGNYYNLVQYYIKPLSAYSAYLQAVPFLAFKTTNKGILRNGSENAEIPAIGDITYFKQSIKDIQSYYRQELINYLEDNKTLFPNYRSDCEDNGSKDYSNGIWLG